MHGRIYAVLRRAHTQGQPWVRVDMVAREVAKAHEIEVYAKAAHSPKYAVATQHGLQWLRIAM